MRKITYTVGVDKISPSTVQFAGFAGEDCATKLVFAIDGELRDKISSEQGVSIMLECIDNSGEYDAFVLTQDVVDAPESVTFDIPKEITELGGRVTMQLSFVELDADFKLKRKLFAYPIKLRFAPSTSGGIENTVEYERYHTGVLSAMVRAEQAEVRAKDKAQLSSDAANDAEGFAQSAETAKKDAERFAQSAEQSATNASQSASDAVTAKGQAEQYQENAKASAADALQFANNAAQSAKSASDFANDAHLAADETELFLNENMFFDLTPEMADHEIRGISSPSAVVKYVKKHVDDGNDKVVDEATASACNEVQRWIMHHIIPQMGDEETGTIASPYAVVHYVNDYAVLKPQWSQFDIPNSTLTEAVATWRVQAEKYGDTTKGVRAMLILPPNTTLSNNRLLISIVFKSRDGISRSIDVRADGWTTTETQSICVLDVVPHAGVWNVEVSPYQKAVTRVVGDMMYRDGDNVRDIIPKTDSTNLLPVGSTMIVWGLSNSGEVVGDPDNDYILTVDDKQEIADLVIDTLPKWEGGSF